MSKVYDAVVIGAGHNGLCCAAYLARAGWDVLVLERRERVGGVTVTEEVVPGFHFSSCSYVVSLLRPWIIEDLRLTEHGYEVFPLESTFTPYRDGSYLFRGADPDDTRREIAKFSPADAEVYPRFGGEMSELARLSKVFVDQVAPDPFSNHPRDLLQLGRLGRSFRGKSQWLPKLYKLFSMSAVDLLSEWFESERLIAAMSVSGIIGTFLGVRSPGTAYVLLHHYMGEIDGAFRAWGLPKGGTGGIAQALCRAACAYGAQVRTGVEVEELEISGGKVRKAVLEGGEEVGGRVFISGADPRRTFEKMVGFHHLPGEMVKDLERFKYRGSSGKVNLALDRLPEFRALPGAGTHLEGDITIAPSIRYLERAYDDAKYGNFSREPFMDIVIPSLLDPTLAPAGKHVMSIFVQYAPYHLQEGPETWQTQREAFGDQVIHCLSEYLPGLEEMILGRQVLTPWDLEKTYGLPEGNIFHGELGLDQLAFFRPARGWARYKTPIESLWLCGSGTHPGGGIMGAPGALCARRLLREGAR